MSDVNNIRHKYKSKAGEKSRDKAKIRRNTVKTLNLDALPKKSIIVKKVTKMQAPGLSIKIR